MTFQTTRWGMVLPALRDAILHSETIDVLLRKTLSIMNAVFQVDGILWVGVEEPTPESYRVYSTTQSWSTFARDDQPRSDRISPSEPPQSEPSQSESHQAIDSFVKSSNPPQAAASVDNASRTQQSDVIRRFRPTSIPLWLTQQREHPQLIQLETGDLIVPVFDSPPLSLQQLSTEPHSLHLDSDSFSAANNTLRFIFQFRRIANDRTQSNAPLDSESLHNTPDADGSAPAPSKMTQWDENEMMLMQSICHQLILARDALRLKRRLESSQRHSSLLSRTAHVLNTSVHPDVAIKQILAEMGQSMRSDRLVLFDLRHQSAEILSTWERLRQRLTPLSVDGLSYALWQDTIDLFLLGGASYIEFRLTNPDLDPLQTWFRDAGISSALVLPIFIREDFFGAIAFLSHRHDRNYLLDELQMAQQNTDQLSIALAMIQNSRSQMLNRDSIATQSSLLKQPFLTDEVTHLPNREALEKELENLSAASVWAFRIPFSLIVCDIDYFKLVNDNHGHDVGDRVLQRLAQRLQNQLRRNTLIYRYGGEEFAIILEETGLQTAREVAERLRQSIRSMPLRTSTEVFTITASFGVAQLMPECDRHALEVLKRSESALFEAKRQGRDRVATRSAILE